MKKKNYLIAPESRRKKINWKKISGNPKAIKIIEEEYKKVPNKLDWDALCANENPEIIKIIEKEYDNDHNSANINWDILSGNPKAINLLTIKINEEKKLSNSPRSKTKKINWEKLSGNRKAIRLLKANTQKIYWNSLSGNTNPKAIQLLKDRTIIKVYGLFENEHIDWDILSGNPNAINLIIDRLKMEIQPYWYPDGIEGKNKINWSKLLANPSIFTVNRGSVQFTEQEKN
jgi:rhodanese-related sulfurtransferase